MAVKEEQRKQEQEGIPKISNLPELQKAAELTFTGRKVHAKEAQELGLVLDVCVEKDLMSQTLALANIIAKKPAYALRYSKRLMKAASHMDLNNFLNFSALFQGICHNQKEHKDAINNILKKKK